MGVTHMEEWRKVPTYPLYEVSSLGQVRHSRRPHKRRKIRHDARGYPCVSVTNSVKQTMRTVHRLMVDAFMGGLPPGMTTNHKNGIKTDNRLENLELLSRADNTRHSYRELGRQSPKGAQCAPAKMTESDAIQAATWYANGKTQREIAAVLGVTKGAISHIICRRNWKHLGDKITAMPKPIKHLTEKETRQMQQLIAAGWSYNAVGRAMHVNHRTVMKYAPKHRYGP